MLKPVFCAPRRGWTEVLLNAYPWWFCSMKLSVSLPNDDVAFLDSYAEAAGISTRSAALHRAIRLLRATALGPAYEAAWLEWSTTDDAEAWDLATADELN